MATVSYTAVSSNTVWPVWVGNASSSVTGADLWPMWAAQAASTQATYTVANIWPQWVGQILAGQSQSVGAATNVFEFWVNAAGNYEAQDDGTPDFYLNNVWKDWAEASENDRETRLAELARRQQEQSAREQEQRRIQWETAESKERARILLEAYLDDEQVENLRKNNVVVITSEKREQFRIRRGTHGNVEKLDEAGNALESYCIQPNDPTLPIEDVMLAQILHLKFAQEQFERVANKRDLRAFIRARAA